MIRELAIFAARCAIALAVIGCGVNAVLAEHTEVICVPIKVPDKPCTPGGLNYNRAPVWRGKS